jgi:hypothetical protein
MGEGSILLYGRECILLEADYLRKRSLLWINLQAKWCIFPISLSFKYVRFLRERLFFIRFYLRMR